MPLHKDLTGTDLHPPGAHKTQHEDGGSDEISLTGLAGSPALGSSTTATTQTPGDNSTKVATTAYADAAAAAAAGTYTDEKAQDAVGGMVDSTLEYVDATPLLKRAALTGDVTASSGSNTTTIANDAVTYAKMQNVSAASKLIGRGSASGSGDPEEITLGTNLSMSGTTLNASGGGGGGALVFLERHAASSSASLDFTTFISGTYDKYLIVGEGLVLQTNGASLYLRVGTGGGPTYDDGSGNTYVWASIGINTVGSGVNDSGQSGSPRILNVMANAAGYGTGSFTLTATNLQSTSLRKHFVGNGNYADTTPSQIIKTQGIAWTTTGTAATAIQFIPSSGNITSGSITIYGYTNS